MAGLHANLRVCSLSWGGCGCSALPWLVLGRWVGGLASEVLSEIREAFPGSCGGWVLRICGFRERRAAAGRGRGGGGDRALAVACRWWDAGMHHSMAQHA